MSGNDLQLWLQSDTQPRHMSFILTQLHLSMYILITAAGHCNMFLVPNICLAFTPYNQSSSILKSKTQPCYMSNRFSDTAAKESTASYQCLFSLPPFVCFVKVLLSIIMNHVFFSSCSYLFSWLEVECGSWWGAEMNWALALAPGPAHILA